MGISAAIAGGIGSIASAGSSIAGMVGGGGGGGSSGGYYSGSTPPPTYIPQQQQAADTSYMNLVNSMIPYAQSVPGTIMPSSTQAYQNLAANPYAGGAQAGANTAGAYGTGTLAPMQAAGAQSLYGAGQTGIPYASQILQTGFDPQSALYNRTQQQTQDQINAQLGMSGLSGSPYGAGVAAQGLSNFNIDWQNQQLQRQTQAASGYGNLVSGAGRGIVGGSDLGGQAMTTMQAGSQLPYSTYMGQQSDVLGAGSQYAGAANTAFGLDQNTLNALAAYLKLGQSATSIGQQGAAQTAGLNQQLGQSIGSGLSGLSSALNNPSLSSLFAPSSNYNVPQGLFDSGSAGTSYSSGFDPFASSFGY